MDSERAMIETLPELVERLPAAERAAFDRLFAVQRERGRALPPPEMESWVLQRFGSVEAVREQTIVRVTNRHTFEAALFNPLRSRRPGADLVGDAELDAWIARELVGGDFADPLRRTPADVFGRIAGRFCVSASNVAKYDGWHGLVVFGDGNPTRFTREQLADYLDVALRWIAAAHAHDPQAIFPIVTWNCLPKSGATIVHGHMQVALARSMHYARPELWRRAAAGYAGDYFGDLFGVHAALGLALADGDGVRSFAHLTPLRGREVVLLATEDTDRTAVAHERSAVMAVARTLIDPLYDVLRGLIDGQGVRALNMALALPPLMPSAGWEGMPVVARVADRGAPLTFRNDWAAMELYGTPVITSDPFQVAELLRR